MGAHHKVCIVHVENFTRLNCREFREEPGIREMLIYMLGAYIIELHSQKFNHAKISTYTVYLRTYICTYVHIIYMHT